MGKLVPLIVIVALLLGAVIYVGHLLGTKSAPQPVVSVLQERHKALEETK